MNSKQVMNHAADNIRILAASMVEKAKSGHPGGAMGGADFINVLYSEFCSTTRLIRNGKDATVFPRPRPHGSHALFPVGAYR